MLFLKLTVLMIMIFVSAGVAAQNQGRATLSGVVTDVNGAPIPKISVKVTDAAGQTRETVSDEDGAYRFELKKGLYSISFKGGHGFLGVEVENMRLAPRAMNFDVVMHLDSEDPNSIYSGFVCKTGERAGKEPECEYFSRRGNGTNPSVKIKITNAPGKPR